MLAAIFFSQAVAASSDCPCVDVSASLPQSNGCLLLTCASKLRLPTGLCGNVSYGSSTCQTWDAGTNSECVGANRPAFCAEPWCYVDSAQCKLSTQHFRRSHYFSEVPGLFYSYATCGGDHREWDAQESVGALSQRTLTVTIPTITYYPYHHKVDATNTQPYAAHNEAVYTDDTLPFEGIMMEYLDGLSKSSYGSTRVGPAGFNFTWTSVSARSSHSSAWTAAVDDVGSGLSDFSASIFWVTPERLRMTPFTLPVTSDLMMLYVPKPKEDTRIVQQMKKPFQPFTPGVWFTVLLVILGVGTLQLVLTRRLWWDDWAAKVAWDKASRGRRWGLIASRLVDAWYESYIVVISGAPIYDENHRVATRLLNTGLGIFLVVLLSAYTANRAPTAHPIAEITVLRAMPCFLCTPTISHIFPPGSLPCRSGCLSKPTRRQ